MYNKYQQGGMMPPQQQGQGGGLPPELQQILNSLPEDVKQYILSLPPEQQIQELTKIAQSQMQAVQQSPNQMMQRGMNQPPQGQGQPMMKMGGRFQTGSRIGVNSIDNKPLQQSINNVIPNYNYNTIEQPPKYTPAPSRQIKEGETMRINGKDRKVVSTNINGRDVIGYVDDSGIFKPINIGNTTPITPQGGVNTGMYGANPPAKTTTVPTPIKKKPYAPPAYKRPDVKPDYPESDLLPGQGVPPNRQRPTGPIPANPGGYIPGIDQGGGTTSPHNPPVPVRPFPGFGGGSGGGGGAGGSFNYKTMPIDNTRVEKKTIGKMDIQQNKLNAEYNELKQKEKNGTITPMEKGRLKHMEVTGVRVGSTIPAMETINYPNRGQLQQQYTKKKEYGGLLYATAGDATGVINPGDLDYSGYKQENRYSSRNRKQVERNQKRLDKLERKEDRLRVGSARWRMNQNRQTRVQGRMNVNEHQQDVGAYNRDVIANNIGNTSGIPMTSAKPPQTISSRTPQNITPAPPAVITPVPKPTVNPSNNTTNNNKGNGLVRGGTQKVADYQKMLNDKYGAGLAVDGAWGPKTQAAYEKFIKGQGQGNAGGGSTAQTPTTPTTTPAAPTAPTTGSQPVKSKWRQIAGEIGGDALSIAEKLDLGYWLEKGAKGVGLSDSTAKALGWAGSIGQLFIPWGAAGTISKAAKVIKVARATSKVRKAAEVAESAAKVARATSKAAKGTKELLTYGPRTGEFLGNLGTRVGNTAKYVGNASKVAPGVAELGRAGVAYGKDTEEGDKEALRRLAVGTVLTAVGAKGAYSGVKGLNTTRAAQSELGEYANVAGKGLHKKVLDSKTGEYMWKKVSPGTVGDDILNAAKKQGIPNPTFKNYEKAGTYGDDIMDKFGNVYDRTGKLIKKAGAKAKTSAKKIADKVKDARKKPEVETAVVTTKYGGLLYKSGGKIQKNKGMKVTTCKFGCH